MSSPPTRNGGPPQAPVITAKISATAKRQDRQQPTAEAEMPVVFGTRLLAAGDARFDRILVRRCCWCGKAHIHIAFEGGKSSIERAPACAKHRPYLIQITEVIPAITTRRRGAA